MKFDRDTPILLWINILSLDAPLVAVVWLWFLSHLYDRQIEWFHPFLLGSATWLAYAGDRILDGLRSNQTKHLTPRHSFAIQHRKSLLVLWVLILTTSLITGILFLDRQHLLRGIFLTFGVSIYFALVFLFPNLIRWIVPREFVVSLLFVIGTSFFIFDPADLKSFAIINALIWFGAICFINCILISFWEKDSDFRKEEVSAATTSPNLVGKANVLIGVAMGVALLSWFGTPWANARGVIITVEMSLALLWVINRLESHSDLKPLLADLALLTPLAVYWFL